MTHGYTALGNTNELKACCYQRTSERYDIISRVFQLKLKEMLSDFRKGMLGERAAEIMCVEWQKRGLPHAHILLFFKSEAKLRDPVDYDRVVCAEIPDPLAEPELHERVLRFMIHGPCSNAFPSCSPGVSYLQPLCCLTLAGTQLFFTSSWCDCLPLPLLEACISVPHGLIH